MMAGAKKSYNIKAWFLASRPKTLTASLTPVLTGSALGWHFNSLDPAQHFEAQLSLWALLCVLCLQICCNLVNDGMDYLKGTDTDARLGPKRMTQSGALSLESVMKAAGLFAFEIFFPGFPFDLHAGLPILFIGLLSILAAYAYTSGPFPLAYRGLGEIFVVLFFGVISLLGLGFLHTGQWLIDFVVAGLQIGLLASVLLAINNARDITEDRLSQKKTLAARFGLDFAKREIAFLFISAFGLGIFWWVMRDRPLAFLLPLLSSPLPVMALRIVQKNEPSVIYNKALALSSLGLLLFALLLSAAFVI